MKKPNRPKTDRSSGRDKDVVRMHGFRSAYAVAKYRPKAIVRAYFDEVHAGQYGPLMKILAAERTAYRLVSSDELTRVSSSQHHEGVCLLVKPRPEPEIEAWLRACPPAAFTVVLDDVQNPHNVGAIVRMAAHFGAQGLWASPPLTKHGAMARVAEGGTETVDIFDSGSVVPGLLRLRRAGFQIVGADPSAKVSLFEHRFARRSALVLGAEQEGLSELVQPELEVGLRIPGTGAVESLNVAAAAAIFCAEYVRQRAERKRPEHEGS